MYSNETKLPVKFWVKYNMSTYSTIEESLFKPSILACKTWLLRQDGSSFMDIQADSPELSLQMNSSNPIAIDTYFWLRHSMLTSLPPTFPGAIAWFWEANNASQ